MKKLLELEEKLIKAKEFLEKASNNNKYAERRQANAENISRMVRQPAKVTEGGQTKIVSPEEQVDAKVKSAAEKKSKAEAEAAARRMAYRKEGVLKADDMCKTEETLKFNDGGQWSL